MSEVSRRNFVAFVGASALSGCAAIMGRSGNRITEIPVRSCSSSPHWPLFQNSSLRDGNTELDLQREPNISYTPSEDIPVGQTCMLLLYSDYVLSFWRHNNTIYRHHKVSGEINSLSLESQVRNYPALNCSVICIHTKNEVYWIDIDKWEVIEKVDVGGSYTDVLIDSDHIYLSLNEGIQAYLRENGESVWHYETDGLPTGLSSSENKLYIVEEDRISSIRKNSGDEIWVQNKIPQSYSNPVIGNSVYLKTNTGNILSFRKSSGEVNWDLNISGTSNQYIIPSYREETLFMPDTVSGKIMAIDGITGDLVWQTSIPRKDGERAAINAFTSPICTTNKIVVGCGQKGLVCLSNNSGNVIWRKPECNIISPLSTDGKHIYAISTRGLISTSPKLG